MSGYFLVLEGIDGSGKTTLGINLMRVMESLDLKVLLTSEQYSNLTIHNVKEILKDGINKKSVDKLIEIFHQDRVFHSALISDNLADNKIVICDRYKLSSVMYQTAMLVYSLSDSIKKTGLTKEYLEKIVNINRDILNPDQTLFIDIDPISLSHRKLEQSKRVDEKFNGKFDTNFELQNEIYSLYSNSFKNSSKFYYDKIFHDVTIVNGNGNEKELLFSCLDQISSTDKFREFLNV